MKKHIMKVRYKHFQERYKERLGKDLTFEDIHDIVLKIEKHEVPFEFTLDDRIDIYRYQHEKNYYRFAYIFFDKYLKIPLSVYNNSQFRGFIKFMKGNKR